MFLFFVYFLLFVWKMFFTIVVIVIIVGCLGYIIFCRKLMLISIIGMLKGGVLESLFGIEVGDSYAIVGGSRVGFGFLFIFLLVFF